MTLSDINSPLTQTALANAASVAADITGSAVDVRQYKGGMIVEQIVGTLSEASVAGTVQTSANGTDGWVAVATFTLVTTANNVQKVGFDARDTLGYVRYIATVADLGTPAVIVAAILLGSKERV